MKEKYLILVCIVFLFVFVGLNGCTESEINGNSASPFIGSWGSQEGYRPAILTFYSDNTFKSENLEGDVEYGKWGVSDNKLSIIYGYQTIEFYYSFFANNDVLNLEIIPDGITIFDDYSFMLSRDYIPSPPAPEPATISMNIYSRNDATNTVIWLVSGIEGGPLPDDAYDLKLLKASGDVDIVASYTFNEISDEGFCKFW